MSLWRRLEQKSKTTKNYLVNAFKVFNPFPRSIFTSWKITYFEFQGVEKTAATSQTTKESWVGYDDCIVERQRRLTPFNDWSAKYLFLTDPPHLMWSDGRPVPVEDVVGEHEWEPLIEVP